MFAFAVHHRVPEQRHHAVTMSFVSSKYTKKRKIYLGDDDDKDDEDDDGNGESFGY